MRGNKNARATRQDRTAQFVEDLQGRPFDQSIPRWQAVLLGIAFFAFGVATVLLEGWWSACV